MDESCGINFDKPSFSIQPQIFGMSLPRVPEKIYWINGKYLDL